MGAITPISALDSVACGRCRALESRNHHALGMDENWRAIATTQHGMLSQSQLTSLGVGREYVRNQLRAHRWARRTSSVLSTTTGPLSRDQRLWLAVLHAGPNSLIGGLTATAVHGLRGWDRDNITVLVGNELSFEPVDGVHFFRTRRPISLLRARTALPLCAVEPAVLLFAGYERNRRTAHGAVAAVVQQRLTTTARLADCLQQLKPLRRAREFRSLLRDIEGGAQSAAEVDLRKACRAFGLREPISQRARRDRSGRQRYTDAEWALPDGGTLILEVDGAFHDDVIQASADRARNRKLTSADRIVISCSAYELRYDPGSVITDLIALGVERVEC